MAEALRTRGYHGIGLNELLAVAQAPKGVLYHHFPGGKADLAVHAIEAVAVRLESDLDRLFLRATDPVDALTLWMDGAQKALQKSGFERGCPLATIALESTADDDTIRAALARTFERLRNRIAQALQASGCDPSLAPGVATLIVSTYEGALLQARVSGQAAPMQETAQALGRLLRMSLTPGAAAGATLPPEMPRPESPSP